MAYSATPEQDTHITRKMPIVAGNTVVSGTELANPFAYIDKGRRYKNCYPKRIKQANTDDLYVVTRVPGAVDVAGYSYTSSGSDPVINVSMDSIYVWKGHRLYTVSGGAVLATHSVAGALNRVWMFPVTNPANTDALYAGVLVNASLQTFAFTFNAATTTYTETNISATVSAIGTGTGFTHNVAYLNSRLYIVTAGGRIYNSQAGAYETWNATWFTVPEVRGDRCVAILPYRNYLAAFGSQSIEFFFDTGGANTVGSPLQRQEGYTQLFGTYTGQNIVKTGDKVFFLSYEDQLGVGIYTLDGFEVKRISDLLVDTILNGGGSNNPSEIALFLFDLYGDPVLVFDPTQITSQPPTFGRDMQAFSTKQGIWFQMDNPFTQPLNRENYGPYSVSFLPASFPFNTIWPKTYNADGSMVWQSIAKNQNTVWSLFNAEITWNSENFGSTNYKHIKSFAIEGDFSENDVTLEYSKDSNYTNFITTTTKNQLSLGPQNKLKWFNLGPMFQFAPKLVFGAGPNFTLYNAECEYNFGQT